MFRRLIIRLTLTFSVLFILTNAIFRYQTRENPDVLILHRGPYTIYPHDYSIASHRGRLELSTVQPLDPADNGHSWWLTWNDGGNLYGEQGRLGFVYNHSTAYLDLYSPRLTGFRLDYLLIPHWFLILLGTIPILLFAARRVWRHHRTVPHLCPTCNYDLRAHAPGTNCPECGTPIASSLPPPNSPVKNASFRILTLVSDAENGIFLGYQNRFSTGC